MNAIFEQTILGQPQTHALIIGVGAYRHLRGGSGPRAEVDFGLGQLTSPPISAIKFADWVVKKLHNPDAPLGSVELLVSGDGPVHYTLPNGEQKVVRDATRCNIQNAFDRWYDRIDANCNCVALFYFCGHGVTADGDRLLLTQDYGENRQRPFEKAINFSQTLLGMATCQAFTQCFFIDACRNVPFETLEYSKPFGGPLVQPKKRKYCPRDLLILNASAPDESAYASAGHISRFTEALIQAIGGLGSKKTQDRWCVTTAKLRTAVPRLVTRLNRLCRGPEQHSTSDGEWRPNQRQIHICRDVPDIPVTIHFEPTQAENEAVIDLASYRNPLGRHRWECESQVWCPAGIKPGQYELHANFLSGDFQEKTDNDLWVFPPLVEELYQLEKTHEYTSNPR